MSEYIAEHHEDHDYRSKEPVHVHVVNTQERAALYGGYSTISLGSGTPAQQLAAQDTKRYVIQVWADAKVLIGLRDEVGAGKGATILANSSPVPITNQQEVWVKDTGVAANVSVIVERLP